MTVENYVARKFLTWFSNISTFYFHNYKQGAETTDREINEGDEGTSKGYGRIT